MGIGELLDGPIDVAQMGAHRRFRQMFVPGDDRVGDGLMLAGEIDRVSPHIEIEITHAIKLDLFGQSHLPCAGKVFVARRGITPCRRTAWSSPSPS